MRCRKCPGCHSLDVRGYEAVRAPQLQTDLRHLAAPQNFQLSLSSATRKLRLKRMLDYII